MDEERKVKLLRSGRRGYCQHKGEEIIRIPDSVMEVVIRREEKDNKCVYCRQPFGNTNCNKPTWEHITGKVKDVEVANIALCCNSCNTSRSDNELLYWFETAPRCKELDIGKDLTDVIKEYLSK